MKIIVSDSSPLIILCKCNRMNLLKNLFNEVLITQVVFDETSAKNDEAKNVLQTTGFIKITSVQNVAVYQQLADILDNGEASAIALAKEQNLPLLIDEKKGRKIAQQIGIDIIGFLGILLLNYQKQYITKTDILELINEAENHNYRLGNNLKDKFLSQI